MSGARHHRKGDRIECKIVALHRALGVHSERYPLSGATRFRGSGHDIDVYLFGADDAPAVCEVKARKNGAGFATLELVARQVRPAVSAQEWRRSTGFGVLADLGASA